MRRFAFLMGPGFFAMTPLAMALDAGCEPFVAAAEKGVLQAARHSVVESPDGTRIEAIIINGAFYTRDSERWRKLGFDIQAAERKVNAEMRSGKIKLSNCTALGAKTLDGNPTQAMTYTVTAAGTPTSSATAFIGKDGLLYGLDAQGIKVRYRYSGVVAPKL